MKWQFVHFGEVCHLVNGKAFQPSDWSSKGLPIIRIQNLNGNSDGFNYWAGSLEKQVAVKSGDMLLAWSGTPGTSFGAHIWTGPDAVLNQHIFRVDLDEVRVLKKWAVFAVNHQLNKLIGLAHGGVGLKHVTRGVVEELSIPLPAVAEQRRIAAILDKADELRAKRRESLVLLDALPEQLFLQLFGDPRSNDKGWPVYRIGSVISEMRGGANLTPEDFVESGFPILHKGAIKPNGQVILDPNKKTFVGDSFVSGNRKHVVNRKFMAVTLRDLVPTGPAIGLIADLTSGPFDEYLLSQGAYGFLVDAAIVVPEYLVHLSNMPSFRHVLRKYAVGSTQIHIRTPVFLDIQIPIPPIELQQKFATHIQGIDNWKSALGSSLARLDALFLSIQHRSFRGEL